MFNNRNLLNRTLTNDNYGCHSDSIRYLTPCEILKEYLINPCSIFNGTIVQIDPMPPIQPLTMPLLPPLPMHLLPQLPIPPLPPRPRGSLGEFIAEQQILGHGQSYIIDRVNIEGDSIVYDDRTNFILLNPNTTYRFSYITETILGGAVSGDVENMLIKDGEGVPGSDVKNDNVQPGVLTVIQGRGEFMTGNNQDDLSLAFLSNDVGQGESSATLTIEEVLP